jgi:hypothetical protein
MARRVLPWLLVEATLAWLEAQFWPDGGLWLLLIWTVVLLLYRMALAPISRRSVRVVGDTSSSRGWGRVRPARRAPTPWSI